MPQSYSTDRLELIGLRGIPLIQPGDDLAEVIAAALGDNGLQLEANDVLIIAQKIVSKAEGRLVVLKDIVPSEEARQLASETDKDSRLVELILRESTGIVRQSGSLIIAEHRLGLVMANAGIDQSNVEAGTALLLPENPDASAARLREDLRRCCGAHASIVIADSLGRAWRKGIIGHAIGVAGMQPLIDLRETRDLLGRKLRVTEVALADEMAAAATLIMGQGSEGLPAVLIRGLGPFEDQADASSLMRDKAQDLFR